MDDNRDQSEDLNKLDEIDREHGINQPITEVVEKSEPVTSLGKAKSYEALELSAAEESTWKLLNLDLLPSRGMFYPEGVELLIRSATGRNIRHWSTMDEHDPLDVREKINFILNKCTKFKVRGNPAPLNFNDFSEVDKYHIVFRIYELTFPNQENKLMANLRCPETKCKHVNKIQVSSLNLLGFDIPEELYEWYSEAEKCFVIPSEKLGETLRFYLPTAGVVDKIRNKKKAEVAAGLEIDEAFYKFAPYLVSDWRRLSLENISQFKQESIGWSDPKFTVIYKVTEALREASINRATGVCEKCKTRLESSIFLGGSFTTKDIFIVSTRLNELI